MNKKFIYFGTPYVARDTLAELVVQGYVPELVITSADTPRGRGMVLTSSETKAWAVEKGIPVIAPQTLTPETIETIRAIHADYAIVVAYGKILPRALIDMFPLGILNIHYSLLPKYRGASPVESALLHGETVTGVSIQKMVYELDAGDILAIREVAIAQAETTRELRPRLIQAGAKLLVETLSSFENGTAVPTPQDHTQATRCGKIAKEDGLLNLADNAELNWRKYRAYAESPGTYFFAGKKGKRIRVKIKTATYTNNIFTPERVIPEGKKEMGYKDFLATFK